MKNTLIISLILIIGCISGATATYEQINETLYIYDATSVAHICSDTNNNIDKVQCENCTCTECSISVGTNKDYSLDYELNYAPNETVYYTKIITLVQTEYDSSFFGTYKKHRRSLKIDGVEVATYNITSIIAMGARNKFQFKTLDQEIIFGSKTITNSTFFFTELIMEDQYVLINNSTISSIHNRFSTIGDSPSSIKKIGGFTGIFLSGIQKVPFIGDALYNVIYPLVVVIQYTIDFSFMIINLIIYDWWYALLLLEIACLFVATQQRGYVNILSAYINTHVSITMFIYHKITIPLINMMISLLNTIKNLIQWW